MLPPGSAPERLAPVYEQAPCFPAISSTSGGACSGLNPYVGPYIRTVKLIQGILIVTSILQPSAGALNSSSLVASPDQDSADDYLDIGGSTCGDFGKYKWQPSSSRQQRAQWITQNCQLLECGRDREDLCNIIDDRRRHRVRSPTPPRRSSMRDITPSGRSSFRALAPSLR
jgi:hypothetical protein